jgi:TonB family protein
MRPDGRFDYETSQERSLSGRQRRKAAFAAVMVHIAVLLVIFILPSPPEKPRVPQVITITLHEQKQEELSNLPPKTKEKIERQKQQQEKKIRKQLEKQRDRLEKQIAAEKSTETSREELRKNSETNPESTRETQDPDENSPEDNSMEVDATASTTTTTTTERDRTDYFANYTENKDSEKSDARDSFFDDKANLDKDPGEDTESSTSTDANNELDMINDLLSDFETRDSSTSPGERDNQNSGDDTTISWDTGDRRDVVTAPSLSVPARYREMGLQFSAVLKVTVLDSGVVASISVVQSTGFPELDDHLMREYKSTAVFSRGNGQSVGRQPIRISY